MSEGLKEVYRLHHEALLHESKKRSCESDGEHSCESDRSSRSNNSTKLKKITSKSMRSHRQGAYINPKKKPRVPKPHVPKSENHDYDGDQDCTHSDDEDSSQQPLHRCCDPTLYRDMKASCMSCSSCSSVWKRAETCFRKLDGSDHSRNSDFARKERSNYIDIRQCDRECECKTRDCKRHLSWADVVDARKNYWGDTKSRAPSRSERTGKLLDILRQAHLDFVRLHGVGSSDESHPMQQFSYVLNGREVCEKAFLFILCLPKKDKNVGESVCTR
jgi:hypothetical protein